MAVTMVVGHCCNRLVTESHLMQLHAVQYSALQVGWDSEGSSFKYLYLASLLPFLGRVEGARSRGGCSSEGAWSRGAAVPGQGVAAIERGPGQGVAAIERGRVAAVERGPVAVKGWLQSRGGPVKGCCS